MPNTKNLKVVIKKANLIKQMRKITVQETEIKSSTSDYVKSPSVNTGKRIDNVSTPHRGREVSRLKENLDKSLNFVESYGVLPRKLLCERFDGKSCVLNVDGTTTQNVSYDNLSSSDKQEVKSMLNVCDGGMISDAAYHEISMRVPSMPRSHHVIACRNELNTQFDVSRTLGRLPGSYLSLETELSRIVREMKFTNGDADVEQDLKIKISGDGAKVSRVSNFLVVSFSVLDDNSNSHMSQRVLAVVNCDENYSNLKSSLGPLFQEINQLHSKQYLDVDGRKIKLEMFIGGDMKFIQLLLGMNSDIATFACPWCKVSKECRGDISLPWDFYHGQNITRSVEEMKSFKSTSAKANFGSKNPPLLNIETDHYVPDELHMLLRVMDVLMRNLIDDAVSKDQFAKITGGATDNLDLLVKEIQNCGVSFKTWYSKSGELEYTSLTGADMKKVLRHLPDRLLFCIHEDTRDHVVKLWKEFYALYTLVTDSSNKTFESQVVFAQVHNFMSGFLKIGSIKREGYHPKNVTPYLHVLLYHIPFFVGKYGSLSKFSGQAVEKTNDILKHIHQTKSNKLDATRDALVVRKRMELGFQDEFRKKRKYEKVNDHFWAVEKAQLVQVKKLRIDREQKEADEKFNKNAHNLDYENMTVVQIKEKLQELDVKTRLKLKTKLIDLLRKELESRTDK